jgi:hypothetical protein
MHFPIYYPVTVAKSKIAGMGAYAKTPIPARKKIGSLGGTLTTIRKGRAAAKTQKTINLVEFDDNKALDAGTNGNDMRFINHSCDPNTYMRIRRLPRRVLCFQRHKKRRRAHLQLWRNPPRRPTQMPLRCEELCGVYLELPYPD